MKTHQTTTRIIRIILIGSFITLLMAWNINCFGQDTIVQWKGDTIFSKVSEVNELSIKYKRMNNPKGPDYVIDRYDVSMIKYQNGAVDSFPYIKPWFRPSKEEQQPAAQQSIFSVNTPPAKKKRFEVEQLGNRFFVNGNASGKNEVFDILKSQNDSEINKYVRKAKSAAAFRPVCFVGIPLAFAGLILAAEGGSGSGFGQNSEAAGVTMMFASGGFIGAAIALKDIQRKSTAKAVKLYNTKY